MSRRKRKNEEENNERWLVSYADFITLLFAFFTVLYATSEKNLEKAKEFQDSIRKYLSPISGVGADKKTATANQAIRFNTPVKNPIKTYKDTSQTQRKVQWKVETFLEENMSLEEIRQHVFDVGDTSMGVRISLAAQKIFLPESARLKPDSVALLKKLSKLFGQFQHRILVENHVGDDENASHSSTEDSWDLSSSRSAQIVNFFVDIEEIPANRFVALAYGNQKPVLPPGEENAQFRNSRLNFLIVTESAPL